ncbi:Nucleotide-diphospho-sugar transferase [Macleaya cordata]|uniref:Nucleotide-diphospho-sugar transferase n=1 Tax=Macleaya cordata TaxID=56857 RepID=A0A200PS95_MACCD|nr:Nucleotide-diphospho-sugar transferase [Macleaya cordata]
MMTMTRTIITGGGSGTNSETLPDSSHIRRRILTVVMLFSVVALPCLVFYNVTYPSESFLSDQHLGVSATNHSSPPESEEVRLKRVLKEASMEDKTVILTTLNDAWAVQNSIVDLFLESFRIGDRTRKLLDHLVIIALDGKAYKRCLEVHPYCFALTTKGVDFSEEAYFMSPDYLEMMWRRIDFLRSILEMGYNFVFSDADIMWFRDPFRRFYKDADFQIACDNFLGNSYDLNNRPNGGFTYVKSNNRTIQFYKYWYSSRETHPGVRRYASKRGDTFTYKGATSLYRLSAMLRLFKAKHLEA